MVLYRLAHMPIRPRFKLTIDTGNVCNLECPLCPTGVGDPGRKGGLMSLETFKKAIDEVGRHVKRIDLYSWGEPLMNKHLIEMINYAGAKTKAQLLLSTNLLLLNEKLADGLVRSPLDLLIMSCDGASQETYAQYRVGGNLQRVITNMHLMVRKKKEVGNQRLCLRWRFLVFRHNEHEVEEARRMAAAIGVEFEAAPMRTDMAKEILEPVEKSLERDGNWVPSNEVYSAYNMAAKTRKVPTRCYRPWQETTINWN